MTWQDDLAQQHREWVADNAATVQDRFDPDTRKGKYQDDYVEHWLDVEATPEQERAFLERVRPVVEDLRRAE